MPAKTDLPSSQAARDLMWVVNSPSYVRGENVAPDARLAANQINEDALQEFLQDRPSHRVGRYFENLVCFWLSRVRRLEMLGVGLQIRDGKRTIGELDFVYRDEQGLVTHCEVAVKFFLHHRRTGTSDFPGPNAADNFELKTNKLFSQQLKLSVEHFPSVQQRHAFVKGMTFYRGERPDVLPERMNPAHGTGSWMYAREIEDLADRHDHVAAVALKPHWLAPARDVSLLAVPAMISQLRSHFDEGPGHPMMISVRNHADLHETERVFVVADDWPA